MIPSFFKQIFGTEVSKNISDTFGLLWIRFIFRFFTKYFRAFACHRQPEVFPPSHQRLIFPPFRPHAFGPLDSGRRFRAQPPPAVRADGIELHRDHRLGVDVIKLFFSSNASPENVRGKYFRASTILTNKRWAYQSGLQNFSYPHVSA